MPAAAARRKVTGDARRRHEAMQQPAGEQEACEWTRQEATGPQLRQPARKREANGRREERRHWTRGDGASIGRGCAFRGRYDDVGTGLNKNVSGSTPEKILN